jgi:aromatase
MAGHTDNSVVINAPMDLVWDMTNDVESWPQLFSEYAAAEILGRDGDTITFRLTMHPDDQGRVWTWVSQRTPDPSARRVRAHRLEAGAFKWMNLQWEYVQTDEGVRMRWVQDFEMRPDAHTDDEGMAEHLNRTSHTQMARIKEIVEKGAADHGDAS